MIAWYEMCVLFNFCLVDQARSEWRMANNFFPVKASLGKRRLSDIRQPYIFFPSQFLPHCQLTLSLRTALLSVLATIVTTAITRETITGC